MSNLARRVAVVCSWGCLVVTTAHAAPPAATPHPAQPLVLTEPGPVEAAVLYATGEQIEVQTETETRLFCGSDVQGVALEDVQAIADQGRDAFAEGQPTWQISAEGPRGGLNIVFNVSGGLPAGAQAALDAIALYIESQFTDPVTVTINFSMVSLSPGILGGTSSQFVSGTSYTNSRNGLVNGMDADDTIQNSLPAGSSIPVRYDASTATITNENVIRFTRAAYNSTIGASAGTAATIQINTNFSWDYDPSNGVTGGAYCYQSVLVHEVGHVIGFISRVDAQVPDMDVLDIYRFQFTDGAGTDWNPDDLAEFSTTARTVDFNNLNDDAMSDIITNEYRMSDGSPNQASHFREQVANIGIMDPTMNGGTTFFPNFFRNSDLNMFDAIGWDRVVCAAPIFDTQPASQTITQGDPVTFSVVVSGGGPFTYQWRRNGAILLNGPALGGGILSGVTSANLNISAVGTADQGNYDCVVTNACASPTSAVAVLTVCVPADFIDVPDDLVVEDGDPASFSVVVSGSGSITYEWRKDGLTVFNGPAAGGGTISGATSPTLLISAAGELDEGDYTCNVRNSCSTELSPAGTLTVNPGIPSAAIIGALSRKGCDLPVTRISGAGALSSEPRQGGVTELRIAFDVPPAGPGGDPASIEEETCAAPGFVPYTGASVFGASIAGSELVLTFTPGLENARSYRIKIGSSVSSIPSQSVELRGLVGDVNSDGSVDALDRSVVVGAWTGGGFTCSTDINGDAGTNALDRSIVVGAWTGGQNCAP